MGVFCYTVYMTTQQIAERWVELVRNHQDEQAMSELYSEDIVSIENNSRGEYMTYEGFDGKAEKNQMWANMVEKLHSATVSDPVVADRAFACTIKMDVTYKNPDWGRQTTSELCVLEIKDGKIIREEYIY